MLPDIKHVGEPSSASVAEPTARCEVFGIPVIGRTVHGQVRHARPETVGILHVSLTPMDVELPGIGTAYVDLENSATVLAVTDANGFATVPFTIPAEATPGDQLFLQWATVDLSDISIVLSDSVQLTCVSDAHALHTELPMFTQLVDTANVVAPSPQNDLLEGQVLVTLMPASRDDELRARFALGCHVGDFALADGSTAGTLEVLALSDEVTLHKETFFNVSVPASIELKFDALASNPEFIDEESNVLVPWTSNGTLTMASIETSPIGLTDLEWNEPVPVGVPVLEGSELKFDCAGVSPLDYATIFGQWLEKKILRIVVHSVNNAQGGNAPATMAQAQGWIDAANDILCPQCCIKIEIANADTDQNGQPDMDNITEAPGFSWHQMAGNQWVPNPPPQPGGTSVPYAIGAQQLATLHASEGGAAGANAAGDIYFIDDFVSDANANDVVGRRGTLGVPGMPMNRCISSLAVDPDAGDAGRTIAHEIAHSLGLGHVNGQDGQGNPDPIGDPDNLMNRVDDNDNLNLGDSQCLKMRASKNLRGTGQQCFSLPLGWAVL